MVDSNLKIPTLKQIKTWATKLGFSDLGIANIDLKSEHKNFVAWVRKGYAGDMRYLKKNLKKRLVPNLLVPETCRIISVSMTYLPADTNPIETLADPNKAYVARYALGRDYHKVMRKKLIKLAAQINRSMTNPRYRVFVDSAPVLEKAIGAKAQLGWIGKNTLLLNKELGSWFFLGEIYTNAPLETQDQTTIDQCGKCSACMSVCPTNAILGPKELDASRCISYLTIEHKGVIPEELRDAMGNRIFGCDDCQLYCPWNREPSHTKENDFQPRNNLDNAKLLQLFTIEEENFEKMTRGSPIRRINFDQWQRNLAIAIGNGPKNIAAIQLLEKKLSNCCEMVAVHIQWAIAKLKKPAKSLKAEKILTVHL